MMQGFRQISPEVYYRQPELDVIGPQAIDFLKQQARGNPSGKCRLCLHQSEAAPIHEMLIVHTDQVHVPPHSHADKGETLMALEGEALLFFFMNTGEIKRMVRLGGDSGDKICIIPPQEYHSLLILSPCFVFQETTKGPFSPNSTHIPDWAPNSESDRAVSAFRNQLLNSKYQRGRV